MEDYDDTIVTPRDLEDLTTHAPLRDCVVLNLLTHFAEVAQDAQPPVRAAVLAPDLSNSIYLTVIQRQMLSRPSAELGPEDLAVVRISGCRNGYDYLLMPVHAQEPGTHIGHWMIGFLDLQSKCVTFFDPLQPSEDHPNLRAYLVEVLRRMVASALGHQFLVSFPEKRTARSSYQLSEENHLEHVVRRFLGSWDECPSRRLRNFYQTNRQLQLRRTYLPNCRTLSSKRRGSGCELSRSHRRAFTLSELAYHRPSEFELFVYLRCHL